MSRYQTVDLADLALVGDPLPLPPEFANLSDAVVSDFSAHIDPPPVGYAGKGLFPLVVSPPVLDSATEADTGVVDLASRAVDADAGVVRAVSAKRPLTAEEIAARNPVPETISDRQFAQALAKQGVITQDEALAFVKRGEVPAMLQAAIDAVDDADERFDLDMAVSGATTFDRNNPSTVALAGALGWSSAQMDDLWRFAAAIR